MTSETQRSVRDEMLFAAVDLLHEHGPDALQTRKVAGAAGTSTMAVYTHFGGMRGLIAEVAEEGLRQFDAALTVPETADPVADLFVIGAAYRRYAIERPHMYRLMFGSTSAHGINAPASNVLTLTVAEIAQRYPSFAHVVRAVHRCMLAGRISAGSPADDPAVMATAAAVLGADSRVRDARTGRLLRGRRRGSRTGACFDDVETACRSGRFTRASDRVAAVGDAPGLSTRNPRNLGDKRSGGFREVDLLDGDGGAGGLELGLGLVGGLLGDLLQQRLRCAVDQILGLLEAQAGDDLADNLDDADLLVAGGLEDDVELRLLLGGLGGAPPAAGPAAATATGAAAVTSKVSSNFLTKSESSSRVISLKASSRSSVDIFGMVVGPSWFRGFGLFG